MFQSTNQEITSCFFWGYHIFSIRPGWWSTYSEKWWSEFVSWDDYSQYMEK